MKTIVGLFKTQARARDALYKLQAAGFDPQGVSVISGASPAPRDADVGREGAVANNPDHTEPYGGLLDMLLVPGLNAIQGIAQPLREPLVDDADELTTANDRTEVGSIPPALPQDFHQTLVRWGLPDAQIHDYESHVASGGVLVAVQAADNSDISRAQEILQQDGAGDVAAASTH